MPFDVATAKPLTASGFDPATAKPAPAFDPGTAKPFTFDAASAKPAPSTGVATLPTTPAPPKQGGTLSSGPIIDEPPAVAALRQSMTGDNGLKPGSRGDILPIGRDAQTGKRTLAVPEMVRSLGRGALDLVEEPYRDIKSRGLKPTGDEVGTGMMFAPGAQAIKTAAPAARAAVTAGTDAAKATGEAFERLLSPTTVGPKAGAAERIIRKSSGTMNLAHEKAADQLVQHNKLVGNLPVPEQRQMISDIENGRPQANPKLQPAADQIRQTYDGWKQKVQATLRPQDVPNFIQDYYTHIWKEKPGQVLGAISKQGSGRNFKARSLPTIEDGIKAGLTPKYENPIESTMAYSQNMAKYVATHDMLGELKTQGYAKWYGPGSKNIPQGWVPLDGIMTKKTSTIPASATAPARGRAIQLYGPPEVARVFNNFISKGLDQGDAAPFYQAARTAANGMTQLKLGLSTYHLGTMANESMISDYARAFRSASRGEFGQAAKAFVKAPTAPVTSYQRGMKMQRELLDKAMPDAMSKKVNDAFVRSGQTLRMDPFYRTRASGSFYNAFHKGTLGREIKDAASKIYKGTAWEKTKGVADLTANVIQTTAAPLFEHYIPAVKRGAFASEMEDFLKANPNASQEMIDREAVKAADSIDNRFGELNQDNLFWSKKMKQAAQLALLAPTWDLGTVREIGGGLKDLMKDAPKIAKGEGISRRTAYVAGLAFNTALMSSIYQYLKTGKAPDSAQDLMAPKTGGTDAASGAPERASTPGYQKDVFAFGYDFPNHVLDEAANKLNPALSTAAQLSQNKDYRGLPIMRPEGVAPIPGEHGLSDYLFDQFLPISVGQFRQGAKKGSNIGTAERSLSVRPAPAYLTDPQRVEDLKTKYGTLDWRKKVKADNRAEAQKQ